MTHSPGSGRTLHPPGGRSKIDSLTGWLADGPVWRPAVTVALVVILAKLPLVFTTLGEQDHGRLLIDAIAYADNGPDTLRKYGIYTSPLWTLTFALLSSWAGVRPLVMISNIGGWLCGGLISGLMVVLIERLGATRAWAVAGGIAVALAPGTFYMSLYGYPSQFALALLLGAAACFALSLGARGRQVYGWLGCSAALYVMLTLTKIDFAVAGTLLVAVALAMGRLVDRRTAILPLFAVVAGVVAMAIARLALKGESLWAFLTRVGDLYPWQSDEVLAAPGVTVLYSCGIGLVTLLAGAWVFGLIRKQTRLVTFRDVAAWAVAVLPMWLFWIARPPMSNRHAVPGVIATVVFAVLAASRLGRRPRAAILWLVAVVVINSPFGKPNYDFNYRPSGNLIQTLRINRRAFAVANRIADDVAGRYDPAKVLVGVPQPAVLGGIDLLPFVELEMAVRAARVQPIRSGWELVFTFADGRRTLMMPAVPVSRAVALSVPNARYYALYGDDVTGLRERRVPVVRFEPNTLYANQ